MDKKTILFTLEKETKNTGRYQETPEPGNPQIVGTLYVQKWALGHPVPKQLKITLEEED